MFLFLEHQTNWLPYSEMKRQSQSFFLKISVCQQLRNLEGKVTCKAEMGFSNFTCPISLTVPRLGWSFIYYC